MIEVPSQGDPGSCAGREPVAITMRSPECVVRSPALSSTSISWGEINRAFPRAISIPRARNFPSMARERPLTSAFLCDSTLPQSLAAALLTSGLETASLRERKNLVGMQPRLVQVPPKASRSTMRTDLKPASTAASAAAVPAGPLPMMIHCFTMIRWHLHVSRPEPLEHGAPLVSRYQGDEDDDERTTLN
jgi:hypothetical protein